MATPSGITTRNSVVVANRVLLVLTSMWPLVSFFTIPDVAKPFSTPPDFQFTTSGNISDQVVSAGFFMYTPDSSGNALSGAEAVATAGADTAVGSSIAWITLSDTPAVFNCSIWSGERSNACAFFRILEIITSSLKPAFANFNTSSTLSALAAGAAAGASCG